jgi:hypothetical protein
MGWVADSNLLRVFGIGTLTPFDVASRRTLWFVPSKRERKRNPGLSGRVVAAPGDGEGFWQTDELCRDYSLNNHDVVRNARVGRSAACRSVVPHAGYLSSPIALSDQAVVSLMSKVVYETLLDPIVKILLLRAAFCLINGPSRGKNLPAWRPRWGDESRSFHKMSMLRTGSTWSDLKAPGDVRQFTGAEM